MKKLFLLLPVLALFCAIAQAQPADPVLPSEVFFTKNVTPESVLMLFSHIAKNVKGKVAIKTHFGEDGNSYFIPPTLLEPLCKKLDATIVETNVAYKGRRRQTETHIQLAKDHGFTFAPIDILDAGGTLELPVRGGKHIKKAKIGKNLEKYNTIVYFTHFKGHSSAGFGGCIKNASMGMATPEGKREMHSRDYPITVSENCIQCGACVNDCPADAITLNPLTIDREKCIGCGKCIGVCPANAIARPDNEQQKNFFMERLVEYAKAATDFRKSVYLSFIINVSPSCDCSSRPGKPFIGDIGILASTDIVAIEKAALDLVNKAHSCDDAFLKENNVSGNRQIEYAERLNMGISKYKLIDIDKTSANTNKMTPQDAYKNFFLLPENELEKLFAAAFLKQVDLKKILEIRKIYTDTLGEFVKSEQVDKGFKLYFQKGNADSSIGINSDNKIASIWFGAPNLTTDTFDQIAADLKKMPGKVSVCLLQHDKNGKSEKEIFTLDHKIPLGCGSAFKLYLLKALEDTVAEGKAKMSDTIALNENLISFPSGILQEWPIGSHHTLETLAGLMISVSDNTATDHIFNFLGLTKLRGYFPETCTELLTTSQFIKFKFAFKELAEEYVKADASKKSEILKEIDAKKAADIDLSFLSKQPAKPFLVDEIEWHISTLDLCRVIFSLRDNKLLRINPATGIASKADWHIIGYKGGSEPGVLNFTWVMQKAPAAPFYTLSCTAVNSEKDIDISAFSMLASRLINLIRLSN
ncbi:MAG: DUF362 domain-containing protein [Candidatus Riflebacteria bacterium]|nr:DUF362 domain-containing protein [Candidatus Riflebacteria bacterium]